MTDIVSPTTEKVLRDAQPGRLADAIRKVDLAQILEDLSAPTAETKTAAAGAVGETVVTLSKVPIGPVLARKSAGGVLTEIHPSQALAANTFTVNRTTRVATFREADVAAASDVNLQYTGLTAGTTSGSELAEDLAELFENAGAT